MIPFKLYEEDGTWTPLAAKLYAAVGFIVERETDPDWGGRVQRRAMVAVSSQVAITEVEIEVKSSVGVW